jgi:hypothetical protein
MHTHGYSQMSSSLAVYVRLERSLRIPHEAANLLEWRPLLRSGVMLHPPLAQL